MRPGDLVEFKAGTFGIEAPDNAGLYLDRVKRKGDFFVVLLTSKGKQEFKRDRIGRVLLSNRLPAEVLKDEAALKGRLGALLKEARSATTKEAQHAGDEARDRDLWRRIRDPGQPQAPAQLAAAFFESTNPGPEQVAAVRKILEGCARPGVGYFERVQGGDELWRPLARDELRRITEGREKLQALKNKLVKAEEVEEDGRRRTVYRGVPIEEAALDDAERERLRFLRDVMEDYVLHDRLTKPWGVGGTTVHTIDGWSLFDTVRFLAIDWTGTRATVSSAFVEFLLAIKEWDPRTALEAIARRKVLARQGFSWTLDEHAAREAAAIPTLVEPDPRRKDYRAAECYTIDPPDAKDFDDAVGVEPLPHGGWRLTVHIADVSHYVKPGSRLDRMARERATSLYLPTGVLPMLPPKLSEDLCSLRAGTDRHSMSVEIDYDAEGRILQERFHEGIIRVRANKHYAQVEEAIGAGVEPFATMARLAKTVGARRRGLSLETGEVRIKLDADAIQHHIKFGTVATKMIEVFMVAANEAVARHLDANGLPQLFRCHPLPDRANVRRFNAQMRTMGLDVSIDLPAEEGAEAADEEKEDEGPSVLEMLQKGKPLTLVGGGFLDDEEEEPAPGDDEEPKEPAAPILRGLAQLDEDERETWLSPFRKALETVNKIEDPDRRGIVYVKLLSCMGRAFYTPDNLGHFGLGSASYHHFTSPIRRYPDLVCHRQLRSLLRGEPPLHDRPSLLEIAPHCSDQGSGAEEIERTVVQVALLFEERASGRPWPRGGWVNAVHKKGIFVNLGHGLEARVFPGDIPGGPYDVDENDSYLFVGTRTRPEAFGRRDLENWRETLKDETGELERVKLRLGDRLTVVGAGFDYIDGRVVAKLAE